MQSRILCICVYIRGTMLTVSGEPARIGKSLVLTRKSWADAEFPRVLRGNRGKCRNESFRIFTRQHCANASSAGLFWRRKACEDRYAGF